MFEILVESGRVVVVARRKLPKVPMADACFLSDRSLPYGRLVLAVHYEEVPGHPGTRAAKSFFVGDAKQAESLGREISLATVDLFAHAPRILIADHAFLYQKLSDDASEGSRALRACEGSRRLGTFRADSLDVGGCLRTGRRRCVYQGMQVRGGVAAELKPSDAPEDEDEEAEA